MTAPPDHATLERTTPRTQTGLLARCRRVLGRSSATSPSLAPGDALPVKADSAGRPAELAATDPPTASDVPDRAPVDNRDDWAAWARAVAGDAASAAALMRSLGRLGVRLAQPLLQSSAAAEDAVQEALLRLWRSPPQDRGTARLSSYFATIVLNVCRDQWAQSRRESSTDPELINAWQDGAAPEGVGSPWSDAAPQDPGAQMDARNTAHQLAEAVASLPPRQRLAISLWAYADASTADIARALELDPNATHQLLHRAKQALRQRLAGASLP